MSESVENNQEEQFKGESITLLRRDVRAAAEFGASEAVHGMPEAVEAIANGVTTEFNEDK